MITLGNRFVSLVIVATMTDFNQTTLDVAQAFAHKFGGATVSDHTGVWIGKDHKSVTETGHKVLSYTGTWGRHDILKFIEDLVRQDVRFHNQEAVMLEINGEAYLLQQGEDYPAHVELTPNWVPVDQGEVWGY